VWRIEFYKKIKYILLSNFPEVISTNMLIGNHVFKFKYTFNCKKMSTFSLFF